MSTDYRALCSELTEKLHKYTSLYEGHESELVNRARAELAKPEPEPPADKEVTELVAWLRDRANSTSLAHTARRITRAADLLERLASDNAGLAAAADGDFAAAIRRNLEDLNE